MRRQLVARLTLLVGIFCAFSQISGALHWVLVEHARCAEHGELVHTSDGDHAHSDTSAAPSSVSIEAGGSNEHGHDHCEVSPAPRELMLVSSAPISLPPASVTGSSGDVRCSDAKASIAGYALAPKTSPPASAS